MFSDSSRHEAFLREALAICTDKKSLPSLHFGHMLFDLVCMPDVVSVNEGKHVTGAFLYGEVPELAHAAYPLEIVIPDPGIIELR